MVFSVPVISQIESIGGGNGRGEVESGEEPKAD